MSKYNKKNTIKEFGDQFKFHNKIDNYWGSSDMLKDIVFPFNFPLIILISYFKLLSNQYLFYKNHVSN